MLVHFPSALFPLDFISSLGARYLHENDLLIFSFYGLIAGVFFGWVAAVFGALDVWRFQRKRHAETALTQGFIHGSIQVVVLIAYSLILLEAISRYPAMNAPGLWLIIGKGSLVLLMIVSNFIGGEIVLKTLHRLEQQPDRTIF